MADFWIEDEQGRVLGPIGVGILRDLITAGRLERIARASRDGRTFAPLAEITEVAGLVRDQLRQRDEAAEAGRLREAMEELRTRPLHEVFGVERGATLAEYREAFLRLVKQYHPDRVRPEAHPDLRQAHDEIFHFLGSRMVDAERLLAARDPAPSAPTWAAGEFVGLVPREAGSVDIRVRVTRETADIFTRHSLVNLERDGVFVPDVGPLAIGTRVEATFRFEPGARTVVVRGKVVLIDAGAKHRRPGVGVKFLNLSDDDRAFVRSFLASATS